MDFPLHTIQLLGYSHVGLCAVGSSTDNSPGTRSSGASAEIQPRFFQDWAPRWSVGLYRVIPSGYVKLAIENDYL